MFLNSVTYVNYLNLKFQLLFCCTISCLIGTRNVRKTRIEINYSFTIFQSQIIHVILHISKKTFSSVYLQNLQVQ